jgi:lambda family phage minor tail protein L
MAQSLVASFVTEKNKLEGHTPLRLFAMEYGDSVASWLYLAAWNENIDYFQPGTATAQTYTMAPIEVNQMERGGINEIPGLSLTISGVDSTMIAYLELYDGLRGREVKVIRTFDSLLSDSNANIVETYYVDGAGAAAQAVEFRLVPRTVFYQIKTPARTFRRNQCQWDFKALYCAGAATLATPLVNSSIASSLFTTCLKTLASCDDYNNTTRYGGFPGIPKQRIVLS